MKLTPQEKEEILRHINAGRPLPDKYRFRLFEEARQAELTWNGKTDAVCDVVLPFQTIEQVDEPRSETQVKQQLDLFDPQTGRQLTGWSTKLIWGDNKLILSSLLRGRLREEIKKQGGLKLIYIDPPFDVGADFSMKVEIGGEDLIKEPGVLEEIAYRDTWGKGVDSFIAMIYERLRLMHDLLADDGSIYVHCDYRMDSLIRLAMDEVFGVNNFRNSIIVQRRITKNLQRQFNTVQSLNCANDTIFWYSKNSATRFAPLYVPMATKKPKGYWHHFWSNADRPTMRYELLGVTPSRGQWKWSEPRAQKAVINYQRYLTEHRNVGLVDYWRDTGENFEFIRLSTNGKVENWYPPADKRIADTIWTDIHAYENEKDYATQKHEALLDRIIKASSNEGDLIADFFCGSGTTAAVAEKLGRKWICSDLGKFAIHTTRKRMIGIQRQLKAADKDYRAFEILNLGKYERQHYIGVNPNLSEREQGVQLRQKERDYVELILSAYTAESVANDTFFQGRKAGRMVAIGPINLPVARSFVETVIAECSARNITRADILAFEFEMGLFPNIQEEAKRQGIDLALKYIPRDVFDKRAVEKRQVVFHDVSYIEVKIHTQKKDKKLFAQVELLNYSVHYSQEADIADTLKNGKSKVVVQNGEVVKISKDKDGSTRCEVLTKSWKDWIDYWAVDFNYESKKEIIHVTNPATGETEEQATGDFIFENEWQTFRTRQSRELEFMSVETEITLPRKIAVKVVDIFGNDTMRVMEVGR